MIEIMAVYKNAWVYKHLSQKLISTAEFVTFSSLTWFIIWTMGQWLKVTELTIVFIGRHIIQDYKSGFQNLPTTEWL